MSKKIIQVWCDGACFPNPGVGGWAYTTLSGKEKSGRELVSTNQRMEIKAALEAIRDLSLYCDELKIYSDSRYLVDGCTSWIWGWEKKNWIRKQNQKVKNQDLWREILSLLKVSKNVTFHWVKGHSGNPGNEEADRLACDATEVPINKRGFR